MNRRESQKTFLARSILIRVLFVFLSLPCCFAIAEARFDYDYPVSSPDSTITANFSDSDIPQSKEGGTKLVIKNTKGKVLFSDDSKLFHRVVAGARWTEDGKYLVMTTVSTGGHSPWHYYVYIFSLGERQIRWLDDSKGTPIVSSEIWCQPPDTVILVGHDFSHGITAPDDPILLRYKLKDLWPKLK